MSLRTYRAYSMADALTAVKRDLGADATIIHTRSYKRGGLFGVGRKTVVEVTASAARRQLTPLSIPKLNPNAPAIQAASASTQSLAARRAYESTPQPTEVPGSSGGDRSLTAKKLDLLAAIEEQRRHNEQREADAIASELIATEIELKPAPPAPASQAPRPATPPDRPASNERSDQTIESDANPPKPVSRVAKRFVLRDPDRATHPTAAAVPRNRVSVVRPTPPPPASGADHKKTTQKKEAEIEGKLLTAVEKSNRESAAVHDEMHAIREMVGQILDKQRDISIPGAGETRGFAPGRYAPGPLPALLYDIYEQMRDQELSEDSIEQVITSVQLDLSADELHEFDPVHAAAQSNVARLVPVGDTPFVIPPRGDRPLTIALIGPTGVGKTTTVAKLAATFKLRHGKRVGLVTSDTYRIAAVEQLRTYADIIGLPLKIALTPAEMTQACHQLRDCDVIMIDTAGRSQKNRDKLAELTAFINAAEPDEVHLVLSTTASEKVLRRAIDSFSDVRADKLILTKLDEAESLGLMVNIAKYADKPISFLTTGQEVPDHFESATTERIADLILGADLHAPAPRISYVAHAQSQGPDSTPPTSSLDSGAESVNDMLPIAEGAD